jgi:transcriptional regulator with GAF, ATPase, and Fis domain
MNFRKELQLKFGIIGNSEPIQKAIDILVEVAPTNLAVLITGETGTGKEVFANAVHSLSNRKNKPFVSVNCGAIPETLLESELFGHEKGAFTSANDQRIGFFEAANKGTIFLDEIGEMPIGTQVKLLRILESGEFSRLGSSTIRKVDVRLIAATNRNLEAEVQARNFRQDLFYRLNSVNIILPALRNHLQDIPQYVEYFANQIAAKNGIIFQGISENAFAILKSLPWQGNIRELKNLVEKVVTLEKGGMINSDILQKYIPPALPENGFHLNNQTALISTQKREEIMSNDTLLLRTLLEIKQDISDIKNALGKLGSAFRILSDDVNSLKDSQIVDYDEKINIDEETLSDMEKRLIVETLLKFKNNKRKAAQNLGISERTLFRKIRKYDLEVDFN